MDRPSCSKVPQCFGSRILRAQSPPLHRYDQLAPCPKGRHYSLTGGSVKLERVRVPKAPKGPALSSRRFQPAESRAERMTPTPKGLTVVRPLQGRHRFFASFPWVSPTATHGMPLRGNSRLIISGCQNRGPL